MTNQDDLFDRIVSHGASSQTLRILLAEYRKNDNPGKALQECIKAVGVYPQDLFLRQMLAESYAEMGFLSQAELELEKITSQMHGLIEAYKLQADIYRRQNRREEALRSLRVYLAHCPEDYEALEVFETLQPPGPVAEAPAAAVEEPEAEETSQAVVEEETEFPEDTTHSDIDTSTLAEVYVNQGEIEEALSIYHRMLSRNPEHEKIRQRIDELEAMLQFRPADGVQEMTRARKKKERAIAVLEAWLTDLRRMYRESATS